MLRLPICRCHLSCRRFIHLKNQSIKKLPNSLIIESCLVKKQTLREFDNKNYEIYLNINNDSIVVDIISFEIDQNDFYLQFMLQTDVLFDFNYQIINNNEISVYLINNEYNCTCLLINNEHNLNILEHIYQLLNKISVPISNIVIVNDNTSDITSEASNIINENNTTINNKTNTTTQINYTTNNKTQINTQETIKIPSSDIDSDIEQTTNTKKPKNESSIVILFNT